MVIIGKISIRKQRSDQLLTHRQRSYPIYNSEDVLYFYIPFSKNGKRMVHALNCCHYLLISFCLNFDIFFLRIVAIECRSLIDLVLSDSKWLSSSRLWTLPFKNKCLSVCVEFCDSPQTFLCIETHLRQCNMICNNPSSRSFKKVSVIFHALINVVWSTKCPLAVHYFLITPKTQLF